MTLTIGDPVYLPRIDFHGVVHLVVPTKDPVIVLRSDGGATLTMRGSKIEQEAAAE